MSVIYINAFHSKQDNLVKPQPTSWDVIVQFLTSPPSVIDNKSDIGYFNAARYKDVHQIPDYSDLWYMEPYSGDSYAKRRQVNILGLDLMVLDYDGGLTIEQAKERFREYEYVCYSSFGHLEDGNTHKFRIILRLATPIPAWKRVSQNGSAPGYGDWYLIRGALEQFTGPCDPKSFDPNQIYALPSTHPSRVETSVSFHHPGERLDWTRFEKAPIETGYMERGSQSGSGACQTGEPKLEPDQVLKTKHGRIKVSEVVGKVSDVFCPFHDDTNPSAFLRKVEKTGNVFLYCSSTQCNRKYYMQAGGNECHDDSDADRFGKQESKNSYVDKKNYTAEEILDLPLQYCDAEDRTRVLKQLEKIQHAIEYDRPHYFEGGGFTCRSHILYMPEGAGKSHLVVNLAKFGHKIIFACKSWEQIEGKYEEYLAKGLQQGFNVRVIRSKDAKARRRFGTKLVRGEPSKPFSAGRILDDETIELFIRNNPDLSPDFIRLSWQFFSSDRLTFECIPHPELDENANIVNEELVAPLSNEKSSIVLTTFEQLRIHRLRGARIPSDWIVWFDDPDITDVIDIEPYDEDRWGELTAERIEKEIKEINGKQYYTRNHNQSLGYTLRNHKCVYTTTEVITRKAIELMMKRRKEQYVVHDEMDNIASGNISVLGTHMVRKRFDGVIPLVTRRLNKMKYQTRLIADGLSANLNHSNNKGRNDLNKTNMLVELSIPHPVQVRTICDALSLPFIAHRSEITRDIMLDRMHQAIGRNSEYRWEGYRCVVLVDPSVHRHMVSHTRYYIDIDNNVLIDRTKSMARKDKRTTDKASPLVNEIETLLNNIESYISDSRKIKPDIKYVLHSIENTADRLKYIIRLLTALSTVTGVRFDGNPADQTPENPVASKCQEIGVWILETWVPEENRDHVIREVHRED